MFYLYKQYFPYGGSPIINDHLTKTVLIEADSADLADQKASTLGIDFDDVFDDRSDYGSDDDDYEGDPRWHRVEDAFGVAYTNPTKYLKDHAVASLTHYLPRNGKTTDPYCHIHYKDGSKDSLVACDADFPPLEYNGSAGAVFSLICGDGKADRLIMASRLHNQRLRDVMCARRR